MNALLHVLSRCGYNHSSCNLRGSVSPRVPIRIADESIIMLAEKYRH